MAQSYNNEPQPTAKINLVTTGGDILLELFAKQTPLTSRNFLQLCLDGYYDNTIFHRLVPKFVLQGGDPTGTGSGGESIYGNGRPFGDEFSNRLKFNRRGLLGMANTGRKNDNGSQFFLTLGDTPELTGQNTMFGRVVGDTIFNLVKMGDGEVAEGTDRPVYPEKIVRTEILVNPFEDMVKRVLTQRAPVAQQEKKKPKKKVAKASLNFGDDDEDGLSLGPPVKRLKVNPRFGNGDVEEPAKPSAPSSNKAKSKPIKSEPTEPAVPSRKSRSRSPIIRPEIVSDLPSAVTKARSPSVSSQSSEDAPSRRKQDKIADTNAQIEALKASMRRTGPSIKKEEDKPKSALEAMIPATSSRGRKRGAGGKTGSAPTAAEQKSLDMFNAFRSKLQATKDTDDADLDVDMQETDASASKDNNGKANGGTVDEDEDPEANLCDLHFVPNCQSCSKWDEMVNDDDDDVGEGWMSHKLSFAKDRLGKDLEWKRKNEEELVVIDPREKERDLGIKNRGGSGGARNHQGRDGGRRDEKVRDRRR